MKISDQEYDKLIKRLEFNDVTRNNLLIFSFTAVLALLGIALEMNMDINSSWICLLPYLLIIPFSARISYYRLSSAHIGAFLRVYASDKVVFEIGAKNVKEGKGLIYTIITFLVNNEMSLLGTACTLTFILKYGHCVEMWEWHHITYIIGAIFLNIFVLIISNSTLNYRKMVLQYQRKWKRYRAIQKSAHIVKVQTRKIKL